MKTLGPPWYGQNKFYIGYVAFLALYIAFLLPVRGPVQSIGQGLNIVVPLVGALVFMGLFVNDKQKPVWLKTTSVLAFVALFCWFFYKYSGADWAQFSEQFLNFRKMEGRYSTFIKPTWVVLKMAGYSCIFAILIGALLAVFRSFDNRVVTWLISGYVLVFRAFPDMVLLVFIYFALPYLGIRLGSVDAVIAGLSLYYGAYITEIFRAGIESIHKTQIEAASILGLTSWQTVGLVIAPQAIRIVISPLTSQLIGILKTTSISYVVGVVDLITSARELQSYLTVATPLVVVSLIYLVIILPFVILSGYLERRSRRWAKSAN
jgi:polar amino acid transport system permease protein